MNEKEIPLNFSSKAEELATARLNIYVTTVTEIVGYDLALKIANVVELKMQDYLNENFKQ